jgi:tetrahydromethanopterin S-methyltransferase subunit F
MANNLEANPKTLRPPFRSREQATLVHAYLSRLENHPGAAKSYISDQLAPTHEDRQRLIARQQELSSGLIPNGNAADAAFAIGQLFQSYLTVRLTEQQSADAITAYLAQVKHLPLWAIQTGCQSCIARNNPFPPSAGELRTACEKAVQSIWAEEAEIRKVLDTEIYHSAPKAQRERIKAGFQTLLAELKQTNSMQPKPKPRFTRPSFGTSTTLSEEAAAKFAAKYAGKPFTDAAE